MPTIFSEWMENGSLENRIDDRTLYEGTPEQVQKRLLDIAIQFARGLHYAHESGSGLIHQDVKPDNLLMSKKWDAKVADFGLARARTAAIVPNGGYTPAYCSPEQSLGEPLTRRTDIYSWAVSILEMYLGEAGGSTDPDCFFLDENFRLVPLAPEVFRNRDQTLFYDAAQVRRFEESRERGDVAEMVRIHRDCLEIPGFGGSREAFQMEDVLEGKAVKNSLRAVRSISGDKVRGKFSGGETVLCSEGRIPGQGKSASGNEGQLLSGGGDVFGERAAGRLLYIRQTGGRDRTVSSGRDTRKTDQASQNHCLDSGPGQCRTCFRKDARCGKIQPVRKACRSIPSGARSLKCAGSQQCAQIRAPDPPCSRRRRETDPLCDRQAF